MIPKTRKRHRGWMTSAGAILLTLGIISAAVAAILFSVDDAAPALAKAISVIGTGLFGIVGVGLLILKWWTARRFDPNDANENERIALGQRLSVPPDEAGRLLAEEKHIQEVQIGGVYALLEESGNYCLAKVVDKGSGVVSLLLRPTDMTDLAHLDRVEFFARFCGVMNVTDFLQDGVKPLRIEQVRDQERVQHDEWLTQQRIQQ